MKRTIKELAEQCLFHDCPLDSVLYNDEQRTLTLVFEAFPFWMQDTYKKGEPENSLLTIVFHEVKNYQWSGDDSGDWSIERTKLIDNWTIQFFLMDEIGDKTASFTVSAESVETQKG